VTPPTSAPPASYLDRLLAELAAIHEQYRVVLDASGVKNIDPNRRGSGGIFIGFPFWGWLKSEPGLEAARMKLLGTVRDWTPRFRRIIYSPWGPTYGALSNEWEEPYYRAPIPPVGCSKSRVVPLKCD